MPPFLSSEGSPQHPRKGRGACGASQTDWPQILDPNAPFFWIQKLYEATRDAVAEYGGEDALAADMEIGRQNLNYRLNRKPDSKGDVQRLFVDTWGHLAVDPVARWTLLEKLCAAFGAKPPEPVVSMTAEDKLRIVAAALSDKARRNLEKEHGLPPGSLDP